MRDYGNSIVYFPPFPMPEGSSKDQFKEQVEELWSRFSSRYSAEAGMPYASAAHKSWLEASETVETDPEAAIQKMLLIQQDLDVASLSKNEIINARRKHQEQLYGRLLVRFWDEKVRNPKLVERIKNNANRSFQECASSLADQIEVLQNFLRDLDEESMYPEIPDTPIAPKDLPI